MKRSLSYHLVALVLKLKGVKKIFSKDPIDYKKLRKQDVKKPKGIFYKKKATSFKILESVITEIPSENKSEELLLFFPGGAFISGPAKHHWDSLKKIYQKTNCTIWMCDYPKAPEHKITQISTNINAIYEAALQKYPSEKIKMIGDSVGATLIMALMQRLVKGTKKVPSKIVLISPVLDSSMSNPNIDAIEDKDIMLDIKGVLSAKKMCAENNNLKAHEMSPIYGTFNGFPETILCIGSHDIMCQDAHILLMHLAANAIVHKTIRGEGMPHIWPLLPFLKEGELVLDEIITEIK